MSGEQSSPESGSNDCDYVTTTGTADRHYGMNATTHLTSVI